MEQPLVSVITVTRNRGPLLGRCIQSVLGQTYKNIEHIVVDGASTDNTDYVISTFCDPRLNYIKLDYNMPIVESLWFAFERSRGEYVTFLDSDDEYVPTKIEKQINLFKSLGVDYGMVYCWMTYLDNKTHKILKFHKNELRGYVGDKVIDIPRVSGTPTYMFKSVVFSELNGWKSKDEIGIISDWELAARCCQRYKVDYVEESLVNVYENHGHQRMSTPGYYKDFWMRNIKFHEYMLKEFCESFTRYPMKQVPHFRMLVASNIMLKNYKTAFAYYRKLLSQSFSLKDLCMYPYYLFRLVRYGVK